MSEASTYSQRSSQSRRVILLLDGLETKVGSAILLLSETIAKSTITEKSRKSAQPKCLVQLISRRR